MIVQLELNEETSYLNSTNTTDQKATVKRDSGKSQSHDQTELRHKSVTSTVHLGKKGTSFMTPLVFTLKVTTLLSRVLEREESVFLFWGVLVLVFTLSVSRQESRRVT